MYITLDMGTTNTRLRLCDGDRILATAKETIGAGSTKTIGRDGLFSGVKLLISALLSDNNITEEAVECILTSGMAGSELGLLDVPHIPLPAGKYELADHLQYSVLPEITEIPFAFVPGLKKVCGDVLVDIMRGEETETAGALNLASIHEDAVLVLPGTHNKVIRVQAGGTITDFYTTLSGELLNHLITNSILAGQVSHTFNLSELYVLRGAAYAHENGLNAALFHIRVMGKNGIDNDCLSSFLYGCVLGQDTDQILKFSAGKPIYIGGRDNLKQVYRILLGEAAVALDETVSEHAVTNGLADIYNLYKARQTRSTVLKRIEEEKLIAIIRNPDEKTFLPAMQALYRGGIRLAEITFDRSGKIPKTQTAHLIKLLREQLPMLVGAGTVTSPEEVLLAYEAGASYIISPNCDPDVIRLTRQLGLVSIPAAFTPTEIAAAIKYGADYVKLFPANQVSGDYVKAVTAPLSDAKLLAVGGVDKTNAAQFLQNGFAGIGIGSNLYDKKLIAAEDWSALEAEAKEYALAVKK